MFAQINHMAMISHQYPMLERFYRSHFKFSVAQRGDHDAEASAIVGDGNVGLNILPRRDGYMGGIDHFGVVVDSIDELLDRMKDANPKTNIVKRPSTRPFAAYSGHDPDGNVFDVAEKSSDNLRDVYGEQKDAEWKESKDCVFRRFAIRTPNAEECAEFYSEVLGLNLVNTPEGKEGYHLTDGRVILSLMQWDIEGFKGMSIKRPGPDHIGIKVPDVEAFKQEVQRLAEKNTFIAARPLGGSKEASTRRDKLAACALGDFQIADPDGNWIDITDD
ncbi:MAG: VOC family protein [Alphaproteobacteria bacterium]|nr:VOC family protein [Alphaproteobacteria bacterium]